MFRTLAHFWRWCWRSPWPWCRGRSRSRRLRRDTARPPTSPRARTYGTHFQTSDRCVACHNGMTTSTGEDISIGINWRTSMMANSARDPYWMAGVRRETLDHPTAAGAHPGRMLHLPHADDAIRGQAGGRRRGSVCASSARPGQARTIGWRTTACPARCATRSRIRIWARATASSAASRSTRRRSPGQRHIYGPFEIDQGRTTIMRSSSDVPADGRQAHAFLGTVRHLPHAAHAGAGRAGQVIGELPEQVPYQEWLHSDYKDTRSCQSCHMPVVKEDVPITSVFGEPPVGRLAAYLRRRQFLHAADAEPLPQRPVRRRRSLRRWTPPRTARSRICNRRPRE